MYKRQIIIIGVVVVVVIRDYPDDVYGAARVHPGHLILYRVDQIKRGQLSFSLNACVKLLVLCSIAINFVR